MGLVDQLGGLQVAVAVAKQRARIPAEEEVELVVYPPRRSFYEVLSEQFDRAGGASDRRRKRILTLLGPRDRRILGALLAPSRLFRSGEILAHMPYVFFADRFEVQGSTSEVRKPGRRLANFDLWRPSHCTGAVRQADGRRADRARQRLLVDRNLQLFLRLRPCSR